MERNKLISLRVNTKLYKEVQRFLDQKYGRKYKSAERQHSLCRCTFADFVEYQMVKALKEREVDLENQAKNVCEIKPKPKDELFGIMDLQF